MSNAEEFKMVISQIQKQLYWEQTSHQLGIKQYKGSISDKTKDQQQITSGAELLSDKLSASTTDV